MAILYHRRPTHVKPQSGVRINWGHPLARGLVSALVFNQGDGRSVVDLVRPHDTFAIGSNCTWGPNVGGSVHVPNGGAAHAAAADRIAAGSTQGIPAGNVAKSVVTRVAPRVDVESHMYVPTCSWTGTFDLGWRLQIYGLFAASGQLGFQVDGGPDLVVSTANGAVVVDGWQTVGVSHDGSVTAANVGLYVNGVAIAHGTDTDGTSLTSGKEVAIFEVDGGSGSVDLAYSYIWNRFLSAEEHMWMHIAPFDILQPHLGMTWIGVAPSAAAAATSDTLTLLGVG